MFNNLPCTGNPSRRQCPLLNYASRDVGYLGGFAEPQLIILKFEVKLKQLRTSF
jgi:hypothetical protein